MEQLVLAELVGEGAEEKIQGLARALNYGDALRQQFQAEHPDWKQKLLAVYELKLAKAKAELEKITENERDRLGDGFDDEEIASSPPCRRAANAIRRLQFQLTVNDEVAWSNFLTGIDAESE